MAELVSSSFLMSGNNLIEGRCRLYGIQIGAPNTDLRSNQADSSNITIDLTNGSSSGDSLFKFSYPGGGSGFGNGNMPISFMFNNHWILFDSGIYVNQMGSDTASDSSLKRSFVRLTLFYEV